MLNLVGNCKVTNLKEITEKMLVGTLVSFEKVGDEFIPTFISAKFVGKARETIMSDGIMDKDKIEVISAVMGTRVWKDKEGTTRRDLQVTVFELRRDDTVYEDKPVTKSKFKK